MGANAARPSWDRLYEVASAHEGHFTTAQAGEVGYSPQLLAKHLRSGRLIRIRRGVYRIVHFPAGDHEDLVVLWLWSDRAGVFSLETALALHELSDVLPTRVHMTLPCSWSRRRLRVPHEVVVHYADLMDSERTWVGSVPVTTPARTLRDCAESNVAPDLVRQALEEGLDRGLFTKGAVSMVNEYLAQFNGTA